jgi:hypothetical protein
VFNRPTRAADVESVARSSKANGDGMAKFA